MARYSGKIGFANTIEASPGVWEETYTERKYYGDVFQNSRRLQSSGDLNDNVVITNEISIVADPYAEENFHAMRYAEWMGAKWKITNIKDSRPRLILTLGGVFNA